jgi:predicted alpha/beta-fold hydrolase
MQKAVTNLNKVSEIAQRLAAKPFRPHPLFRSGHAQTLLGYLFPRRKQLRRESIDEKRLFEVEKGARLLARCRWQHGEPRSFPTILLVHGLEGSSDSVYMLGTAAKAFAAGFNVLSLNLRTCGNTEHLTNTLYHSGMSQDLRVVIEELISHDKIENIFLAGFSLGGNMSLKLAGELGTAAPQQLRGICAVSPSIDLSVCADAIGSRSNWLYNQRFIVNLKKRMRRVAQLYPEKYNLDLLAKVRTIRDFDEHFTAFHGGFKDVDDYYARSSSLKLIADIQIPTLVIQAQDDPFVPFDSFRHASLVRNPFIVLLSPIKGGHVGFVAANKNSDEDRFWAENRIIEFFRLLIE